MDDIEEAHIKSDTLAQAAKAPPPSAADTVLMLARTDTGQKFLIGLVALCMQADRDSGSVMFFMKKGVARFTVNIKMLGHVQTFMGEGENLFVASAHLHSRIHAFINRNKPNAAPHSEAGDREATGGGEPSGPPTYAAPAKPSTGASPADGPV